MGKSLFLIDEVGGALRKHYWSWPLTLEIPDGIADLRASDFNLVRFRDLATQGLWSDTQQPCERTLRTMVSLGLIPHYQVSGMLFFQVEEVRHCLFDGTLTAVAA
jgi:hypothetical protein